MTKRVTERSCSDYTLYSLSTDKSLAVVILEAKMSTNVEHAPAQVCEFHKVKIVYLLTCIGSWICYCIGKRDESRETRWRR